LSPEVVVVAQLIKQVVVALVVIVEAMVVRHLAVAEHPNLL
jgi:hypothetical protein